VPSTLVRVRLRVRLKVWVRVRVRVRVRDRDRVRVRVRVRVTPRTAVLCPAPRAKHRRLTDAPTALEPHASAAHPGRERAAETAERAHRVVEGIKLASLACAITHRRRDPRLALALVALVAQAQRAPVAFPARPRLRRHERGSRAHGHVVRLCPSTRAFAH
jgi:hypothetical protein